MAPGGRSTGCKTCRMRHLKCDEARPECRRCIKAGIECRGYEVIQVFIDERSKILHRGIKGRRKPGVEASGCDSRQASPASNHLDKRGGSHVSTLITAIDPEDAVYTALPCPLLALQPVQDDGFYLQFMRHKLFTRQPGPGENPSATDMGDKTAKLGSIMPELICEAPSKLLEPALNAVTRAWFAKIRQQPRVALESMVFYGRALGDLKTALERGRWRERDLLITAMCLVLYEAIQFTGDNVWMNHARGLGQLIEAQGPESFRDPVGLGILRSMRFSIIMSCTAHNAPCFLDRLEWRETPWRSEAQGKNDGDFLFDIFARVPSMVRRIRLVEAHKLPETSAESIFEDIVSAVHELIRWRWVYEGAHAHCAWIDGTITSTCDNNNNNTEPLSLFPYTLSFASLYDILLLSHYNALLLLLIGFAQRLGDTTLLHARILPPLIPNGLVKSNALVLPGIDEITPPVLAREICQMIRFRMKFLVGNTVSFGLFMPFRMAWTTFKDSPQDAGWLRHVAARYERLSGLELTKLIFWGNQKRVLRAGDVR